MFVAKVIRISISKMAKVCLVCGVILGFNHQFYLFLSNPGTPSWQALLVPAPVNLGWFQLTACLLQTCDFHLAAGKEFPSCHLALHNSWESFKTTFSSYTSLKSWEPFPTIVMGTTYSYIPNYLHTVTWTSSSLREGWFLHSYVG